MISHGRSSGSEDGVPRPVDVVDRERDVTEAEAIHRRERRRLHGQVGEDLERGAILGIARQSEADASTNAPLFGMAFATTPESSSPELDVNARSEVIHSERPGN